ncbi:MAG: hypothetical protein PPP56_13505 [Longimonas sp.]|uniref:hypothetical protein n=1 Tax=Longimonas sp. TaxID=2039626 RepID=UPI00335B2EA8
MYYEDTLYGSVDDTMYRFDDPFAYETLDDDLLDDEYYDEDDLLDDLDDLDDDFDDEDEGYFYDDEYYEDFDGAY